MTPVEAIRRSRALISSPESWTQGAMARDCDGQPVSPWDPAACSWCAYGAILKEVDGVGNRALEATIMSELERQAARSFHLGLVGVNDKMGHPEILRVFHETEQRLKKEI